MPYTITKQFHFSASHVLDGLPDGHQCGRLHGHNYLVELVLSADNLNQHGFVRDYGDLDEFADWIKRVLDHRHLGGGDLPGVLLIQTTAENIARYIYQTWQPSRFLELVAVRVSETPRTSAEYRP